MSRVFRAEDFVCYNGFYGKSHCRQVVLHLYHEKCTSCGRAIDGAIFHVAHIIPRSHPNMMERYFPGLDVDNLLNLKLSCPQCNRGESNFLLDALLLQAAFNRSVRVISSRLESVLAKLQATVKRIEMSGADPKICTDVLHIGVREISSFAFDWHGAVAIAKADLNARVREALTNTFGEAEDMAVYDAVQESINYFHDHLKIDGNSCSIRSLDNRPWLVEAHKHLCSESHGVRPLVDAIKAAGLIDGVYLDPDELETRGGLLIPLRSEAQRWFHEIFATIVRAQRKLEMSRSKQFVVLSGHEWTSLCICREKLSLAESGIAKVGRRLRGPEIVAHFGLSGDELYFGDEGLKVSQEVRLMCQAVATDSIWESGALVRKSKLKSWLARAFSLANQAAQQITGPHLVRIGDERTQYQWVPSLPKLAGKSREEVRLEVAWPPVRGGRRRKSQQSA